MDEQTRGTLTQKAERTREHIFETALSLFVEKGYEETTLRDIAGQAGCSLGLTYRYFASKEDLVLTLYERLAAQLVAQVREMPPASIAERFDVVMNAKLERLAPYREAFGALFGAAINPRSGVAVLGGSTSQVRHIVREVFTMVALGATDAPRGAQAGQIATMLYALHLGLILFSLYDPTPDQSATRQLISLTRDVLGLARRILRLPFASRALARFTSAIEPVFGDAA